MLHLAVCHDLLLDSGRYINRNRKRHTLIAAAAGVDLRIDADHLAAGIKQRAARVAGVDGDVGLDERHGAVVGQGPALGADDAGRHGVFETKGRANRQHPLADLQFAGFAQGHDRQVAGRNPQHGDVGPRIGAQHLGAEFAPVGQLDRDFAGIAHHVCIGQDDAVAAHDEAGALSSGGNFLLAAAALPARPLLEAAEELEKWIAGQSIVVIIATALGQR